MDFALTTRELKIFETVGLAAQEMNVPTYVIGGFVRDKLLGSPTKDMDFVCVGSGIELARKTAAKFNPAPKVSVFKNFGTAMLKVDGWELEFVGARKESYQRHSRKPIVEEGTLQDDLNRRDFTINAMGISLQKEDFGSLLDPFKGQEDLSAGIIRTPGNPDVTFSDDPLRMMRAIRFATQLAFQIEKKTLNSITQNASRIEIISKERITDELNKIIMTHKPSVGFSLLFKTGLLHQFFPEMAHLQGVEIRNGQSHKDNFYHTIEVLDNLCRNSRNLWLRWAAILHDIAKPPTKQFEPQHGWTFHGHEVVGARMVPKIFKRLRLPLNEQMKYVQKMVNLHLRPIGLNKENITDSAIRRLLFEAGDDIDDLMQLCEADITSKNEERVKRYLRNFELVRLKLKEVEEKDNIRNFQPPIPGELIMETFNLKPCKKIGDIKNAIKEAILDGDIANDYQEAFNFMLQLGEEMGLVPKENE